MPALLTAAWAFLLADYENAVNSQIINSFEQALAAESPEDSLVALVQQMKAAGFSQIETYVLFEQFILLTERFGQEDESGALCVVGSRVWGWGGELFEHLLSEAEIEAYWQIQNGKVDQMSEATQLSLFN